MREGQGRAEEGKGRAEEGQGRGRKGRADAGAGAGQKQSGNRADRAVAVHNLPMHKQSGLGLRPRPKGPVSCGLVRQA